MAVHSMVKYETWKVCFPLLVVYHLLGALLFPFLLLKVDPIQLLASGGHKGNYKVSDQAASAAWRNHSRPVKGLIGLFAKLKRKPCGFGFWFWLEFVQEICTLDQNVHQFKTFRGLSRCSTAFTIKKNADDTFQICWFLWIPTRYLGTLDAGI